MGISLQGQGFAGTPGDNVPEEYKNRKIIHICEACGKIALLTPEEGFQAGWDYAPYMYPFGVISPRTCESCSITSTVWWEITGNHKQIDDLTEAQKAVIARIVNEPESILPKS